MAKNGLKKRYKYNQIKYTTMQIFTVYSIGINADIFHDKYALYIVDRMPDYFGGVEFTLRAPAEVREEIAELADNGIEIVG